ncbi:hypothetical protein SAMN05421505_10697 [Sinosporangium album]|uniref:DUF4350 domain-containing protein n=1 Tax=Sinosporangium album TaxID=504805 RepID=A0A1G7VX82_9ACTN|nr:DUF4350 domain-containing protein [Sinosporangium album]SDG64327.1 hypothetical protein SAMN05421505_10697 [Sinosporangium album]
MTQPPAPQPAVPHPAVAQPAVPQTTATHSPAIHSPAPGRPSTSTSTSTSVSPTAKSLWRSGRGIVAIALIILAAAVVTLLLSSGQRQGRPLDPDDTSLAGSHALAQLLRDRGVTVHRVDSAAAAEASVRAARENAQVLVTGTAYLSEQEADRLASSRADLLLVGPVPYAERLAPDATTPEGGQDAISRSRDPGCFLPAAVKAGSAYLGGLTYSGPAGAIGCYPAGDAYTLLRYPQGGHTVTLVGSGDFMTNQRLAEDGNAALALNLAGTRPTLIWLVPSPEPPQVAGAQGKSFNDLIPAGVKWGALQLALAVLLVAFWQGRRLGPVVAEKLPVVVRAAETVEGRGRLYRARRARARAADALRTGTLHRITPRLGLPPGAGWEAVVSAVAGRTGHDTGRVGAALYGPPPADDAGLSALADYLDSLERQVKDS